ncbi:DUF1963 domain-containing protein [Pseudonocardia sp. TRM90224]|uniref:DUF1963 domain-containing protein n=1 Tax=Pseudonocardia sp. TRM90224 TaxID=2812678 RepID=UPI001E34896F|nr:YwqG family protein [Pseudonocardia sp. TRM90224]
MSTNRADLAEHLRLHGLGEHADRLAHEVATIGLLLEPGGSGLSRIGGLPLLPPDVAWPRTSDDRPLSFLAALDLAEIGPLLGPQWPTSGVLMFYADIDPEHIEDLLSGVPNADGAEARVFATDTPTPVDVPSTLVERERFLDVTLVLDERVVLPRTALSLPDGYEIWHRLGFPEDHDGRYDEALEAMVSSRSGAPDAPEHWVGGHAAGVQVNQPDPADTILLLRLASDSDIRFDFLDGGTIQFRIPEEALGRSDWSAVVGMADSA